MNRKSETCTSESGCATSFDKKSSLGKKKQSTENIASNIRGTLAYATSAKSSGPWSYREHRIFLDGLYKYGRNWKQIAALVKSRNDEEVQRHFHSFHIKEPFLFTLRRMLNDKSLDHIIAWLPDGRIRIYNQLTFVRVALLLYFGGIFCHYNYFQTELYKCGFYKSGLYWFHPLFLKVSYTSSELASIKPISMGTSTTDKNTSDQNTEVILEKSRQSKTSASNNHKPLAKASATSTGKTQKPSKEEIKAIQKALKEEIKTSAGKRWSVEEHNLLLEGLEQYGRSWSEIAYHVKTRTYTQVANHGRKYFKKIDCYWTTKEHQLFLEGLEQYGIGGWMEIASRVGTKDKEQVCFHAKEYFKTEEMHHKEEIKTSAGKRWSAEEHDLFLEGLEQYGRSWKNIASHVKTRTHKQVANYGNTYLKKIDCYWTTKEHQLFLEGLEQYGIGGWMEIASHVGTKDKEQVCFHVKGYFEKEEMNKELRLWEEIASHVRTKNKEQVCFHAKEYFEKEEMNKESQRSVDNSDEQSPEARNLVKKPKHNPIYAKSRNAKRSRDQGEDSLSANSKKRKTMESIKQRNDKQTIVTPEKETIVNKSMQNVDTTQSLNPIHKKTTDFQDRQQATCDRSNYENELKLQFGSEEEKHDLRSLAHNAKKTISTTVHDMSCPICLEKFNDPHIVPECCHRFCKGCIDEALKYRRECPICRGRVTSRRSLRRDGLFAKLLRLLEVERAKGNTIVASTLYAANSNQLSDNTMVIEKNQTDVGEENETIGSVESMNEACTKEEGEEEEQIVRNEYNENTKIGLQHNRKAYEHSETQLEEENIRMNTLEKVRTSSDEDKFESLLATVKDLQTQLQQKNDRIQHLESMQKQTK